MKTTSTLSILLAGLICAAGVQAQTTVTSDVPPAAGEASTTVQGLPNAATPVNVESRGAVKAEAQAASKAGTISVGEIGTSDGAGKQAGMEPDPIAGKTRAQLRAERNMKKAQRKADSSINQIGANAMGGATAGTKAGTPSISPAGTPAVMDGGTPK